MKSFALLLVLSFATVASAGEAVVVLLPAKAAGGTSVVTLGQIAKLHGGDAKTRAKLAAVDLVERTKKDSPVTITRLQIDIRLKLAGFTADEVIVGGAESVVVGVAKKTVAAEDVIAAAKKSLAAQFPTMGDELKLDLAQSLAVKLPEVSADDAVTFAAVPHAANVKLGRVQMDVTIKVNNEARLSLPVYLEAKSTKIEPLLVKARQRVTLVVRLGAMNLEATGEALQDGKAGETIKVQNTASKKILSGRVSGAGVVDVEIGGSP